MPNEIDLIAASFVRKGSDLDEIREVLGEKGRYVKIISKVGRSDVFGGADVLGGWEEGRLSQDPMWAGAEGVSQPRRRGKGEVVKRRCPWFV